MKLQSLFRLNKSNKEIHFVTDGTNLAINRIQCGALHLPFFGFVSAIETVVRLLAFLIGVDNT